MTYDAWKPQAIFARCMVFMSCSSSPCDAPSAAENARTIAFGRLLYYRARSPAKGGQSASVPLWRYQLCSLTSPMSQFTVVLRDCIPMAVVSRVVCTFDATKVSSLCTEGGAEQRAWSALHLVGMLRSWESVPGCEHYHHTSSHISRGLKLHRCRIVRVASTAERTEAT